MNKWRGFSKQTSLFFKDYKPKLLGCPGLNYAACTVHNSINNCNPSMKPADDNASVGARADCASSVGTLADCHRLCVLQVDQSALEHVSGRPVWHGVAVMIQLT